VFSSRGAVTRHGTLGRNGTVPFYSAVPHEESLTEEQIATLQEKAARTSRRLRYLCFLMHLLLVLFHVALLIISRFQVERKVVRVGTSDIASLSTTKSIVSQTLAIVSGSSWNFLRSPPLFITQALPRYILRSSSM
jgi:hypothetical protein